MVALAMLVAISIILGKYLALSIGEVLRFSFENLPIIFAGIAFGPISAMLVAVAADLLGCLLVGYAINPLVTVGAAVIGLSSGSVALLLKRFTGAKALSVVILSTAAAHILGSVGIKTLGLAVFYDMPIPVLMLWRLLNYTIIAVLEILIIYLLLKSRGVKSQISKIKA